jgi:N-acetylmuramoyl-L-alanine amidase/Bacterial SH3 domain
MITKYGFTKMSINEFENWISNLRVARTILTVQQHHTYNPNYSLFNENNHFDLQKSMKNYHVNSNGWGDIGQHFTIFPDGYILTGRTLEKSPACITGNNSNSICIENLGNFDLGQDLMTSKQADSIVKATAFICKKFSISINTNKIVYHHWFDLNSGDRNNGVKSENSSNKSCPGTNFFGGNKVEDCRANFLPLINNILNGNINADTSNILKYVCVMANLLNIRKQSNRNSDKITDRAPATLGSVLRVYKIQNGWYKISSSKQHWVSGQYTKDVIRATVNADKLNIRNGAGQTYLKIGSVLKGQELFILEEINGWCKIDMGEKWVKKEYLDI